MKAAADLLHQLLFFRCERIRLGGERIALLREERRLQISPRHDGGQGLPPLHVLFQLLADLVDPSQVFLMRLSPDTIKQRIQHIPLCEDELVHHGREGTLQIELPDGLHGAGADVFQMLTADPNRILKAPCCVDVPFKFSAALSADKHRMIPGKRKAFIKCPDTVPCSTCPYKSKKQAPIISWDGLVETGYEPIGSAPEDEQTIAKTEYEGIKAMMDAEDPRIARSFELKELEGYSVREISAELHISQPRVYQLIARAKTIGMEYRKING